MCYSVSSTPTPPPPSDHIPSPPSCLDHIWFNKVNSFDSGIFNLDLSDHKPTFIPINLAINTSANRKIKLKVRSFDTYKYNRMLTTLSQISWNSSFPALGDINQILDDFLYKLNHAYCENFLVKTKFLSTRRSRKP